MERYGEQSNSLELVIVSNQLKPAGVGASLASLLPLLVLSERELHIRILPGLSEDAEREVLAYFQTHLPEALAAAQTSAGNPHNPKLRPLQHQLPLAIKATAYYRELEAGVAQAGFAACTLSYEKFFWIDGVPRIAELQLQCPIKP